MNVARLRLAPFFRNRLSARGMTTAAANAEDRDVACDVAEEAVPALPVWPLPQRGNLPVSPYAPSLVHRPKSSR
jgi:hypothetical protein